MSEPDPVLQDDFGCDRCGREPSYDAPEDVLIFGHCLCEPCIRELREWIADWRRRHP